MRKNNTLELQLNKTIHFIAEIVDLEKRMKTFNIGLQYSYFNADLVGSTEFEDIVA